VNKSLRHVYAQVIDDEQGHTLAAASTLDEQVSGKLSNTADVEAAAAVGAAIAQKALNQGIEQVVFDRAGYPYHGKVAALAEAAREAGLRF
jgi:large subunit ribosomal protein L18